MTAPFGRRIGVLASRRVVGRYVVLGTADRAGGGGSRPVLHAGGGERWGGGAAERPFLARAVSVMRVGEGGLVEFLLEDVGPGTKRLCELTVGDGLPLVGPFGRGFSVPAGPDTLLVGGGIGIAPLVAVQEAWGGRALLGFRDAEHAAGAGLFADPYGRDRGRLHRPSRSRDRAARSRAGTRAARPVYACGPPAMLAAVNERARRHGVPCELALEAPMACGFGACYGCVVATVDGYRRVCVDGPVFDGAVLA